MADGAQTVSVAGGFAFVRGEEAPALPPPFASTGWLGWGRANLFGTPFNAVLTVLTLGLLALAVPPLVAGLSQNDDPQLQRECCSALQRMGPVARSAAKDLEVLSLKGCKEVQPVAHAPKHRYHEHGNGAD